MLRGKAEWHMACAEYFYVQSSEQGTFEKLDQFVEKRQTKNAKVMFSHNTMKKYKYKYRGKDYKYEQLTNSQTIKLELPTFYNINNELFGCITVESGYCQRLLQTLDRYLIKARFETIKASTVLDIDFLNSDYSKKSYQWQYLQRCYYAENAIYSYYSAFEIILQLIWISHDFHSNSDSFKRMKTFENAVNSCHVDQDQLIIARQCLSLVIHRKGEIIKSNFRNGGLPARFIFQPQEEISGNIEESGELADNFKIRLAFTGFIFHMAKMKRL